MPSKPAPQFGFRINLNLLNPQGVPLKLPTKFLKWMISYGRFIVIFVEIIVVAAFIFRFKLDADLDKLKTDIKNEAPYIEGQSSDETLIRQTQLRLNLIKQNNAQSSDWLPTLNRLSSKMPSGFKINNLNLEFTPTNTITFKITGRTESNIDLEAFLNTLKKDGGYKNAALANITYDQNQIVFTITGEDIK